MSRLNKKDQQLLYNLTKEPGWEVFLVGAENIREDIHKQMEYCSKDDVMFHQGEINGMKSLIKGVETATERLKKAEEADKVEEEVITDE